MTTIHAPHVACIGDLLWCDCQRPDWDTQPVSPLLMPATTEPERLSQWEAARAEYRQRLAAWVATQPFHRPEDYAAHVLEDADRLAMRVAELLTHHSLTPHQRIRPDLVTITGEHPGWHGVALVLDGGYSAEDAALMVEHWRGCLERVLGSLAAVDPYGIGRP